MYPLKRNTEFVDCIEDVIDVYECPYDEEYPVVRKHKKPYQLLGEVRKPQPTRFDDDRKINSEYIRNSTCSIVAFVELLGSRYPINVREHRTATDWRKR